MSIQCRAAAPPAGVGTGAVAGILKSVAQLLHLTFFPRAVSGTTRMLRHLRFGHMMRMFLTGFTCASSMRALRDRVGKPTSLAAHRVDKGAGLGGAMKKAKGA